MNNNDFIPLVTFRGWSDVEDKFIYGSLVYDNEDPIITDGDYRNDLSVCKDSLGIYTGKDDKNGVPIFCCVAGAENGSDIIQHYAFDDGYNFSPEYIGGCFEGHGTFSEWDGCEVIGNQYEQYLKWTK